MTLKKLLLSLSVFLVVAANAAHIGGAESLFDQCVYIGQCKGGLDCMHMCEAYGIPPYVLKCDKGPHFDNECCCVGTKLAPN